MDKYYYFGEFGYLNLEILGGLEQYFKKFPNKKLEIVTYDNYGLLLKYLFGKNVKITKVKWKGDQKSKKVRACHGEEKNELHKLIRENIKSNNKITVEGLICTYISRPLGKETLKKKYISIFPRNRKGCPEKNLSLEVWEEIIKKIKLNSNKKIVLHGVDEEKLDIKGRFIYPKNVLEQIYYLNNSVCCICPDSGFAHFSLNCGCDTLVIGKSYWVFSRFNPFNKKLFICDKEYVLNSEIIKKFLGRKDLNVKEKMNLFFYQFASIIRRFVWYPLKKIVQKFPSLFKKLKKVYEDHLR